MAVIAAAWSAAIVFVLRPSIVAAGATPPMLRTVTILAMAPWACVPLQLVFHFLLRRQLLVHPEVDPRVWPMSPVTKRWLHRSDTWWGRYMFVAPVIMLLGWGAGCALLALLAKRPLSPGVMMVGFVAAGMAALIPPWDRTRTLRARRELSLCERCTYPLAGIEGRTCPECGHNNSNQSAEQSDPSDR